MAIPALLFTLVSALVFLLVVSIFTEPLTALVRRRVPNFSYEGGIVLLWGSVLIATFALGLVVMYLLLKP